MGCGSKISFEERRKWKHKMYSHWRDTLEQPLAGVNAALEKLEEQMERDNKNPPGDTVAQKVYGDSQEGYLSKEAFDNI